MPGKIIIIVGARGAGKTEMAKTLVRKYHQEARLIFDINNEYTELYNRPFIDFEDFAELTTRVTDAVILFDEAAIFINNKGSNKQIYKACGRARHTRNDLIFNFYSLRAVPRDLYDLASAVIIHKTGDDVDFVAKRFGDKKLTEAFKQIEAAKWLYNSKANKHYSPNLIHKKFLS